MYISWKIEGPPWIEIVLYRQRVEEYASKIWKICFFVDVCRDQLRCGLHIEQLREHVALVGLRVLVEPGPEVRPNLADETPSSEYEVGSG